MNNHKTLLEKLKEHLSTLKDVLLEIQNIFLRVVVLAILGTVLIHILQHPGDLKALSDLNTLNLKPMLENLQAIKLIP
jgi:hypothetical protein